MWRTTAAAMIIFTCGLTYHYFLKQPHPAEITIVQADSDSTDTGLSLKDLSPELAEVEVYYAVLVNSKIEELNMHSLRHDESVEDMLLELEYLSSDYNDLKKEIGKNSDNEMIIEAMIENYRIKLEVLEDILNELKEIENKGTTEIEEDEKIEEV